MEQKMYRVINTLDYKSENKIVHEYTIMQYMNDNGHEVTTLHRSHDDVWAEGRRGEEVIKVIENMIDKIATSPSLDPLTENEFNDLQSLMRVRKMIGK